MYEAILTFERSDEEITYTGNSRSIEDAINDIRQKFNLDESWILTSASLDNKDE